ncbi:hypothetical protein WMY93_023360 [Mugilogobius chulae]|uniref:Uncharacterized protein n=1 Tax=Mugilogobius chulae TaxID=88201 RepID=A0AAW0N9L9_9GOBI
MLSVYVQYTSTSHRVDATPKLFTWAVKTLPADITSVENQAGDAKEEARGSSSPVPRCPVYWGGALGRTQVGRGASEEQAGTWPERRERGATGGATWAT